jgi:hypothetical protein
MKTAIVSSNYPNFLACMSAKRFVDSCETCSLVMKCKLPESVSGRIRIKKEKVELAQEQIKLAQAKLSLREQELIEEQKKS